MSEVGESYVGHVSMLLEIPSVVQIEQLELRISIAARKDSVGLTTRRNCSTMLTSHSVSTYEHLIILLCHH